jgi:hypothetical protein
MTGLKSHIDAAAIKANSRKDLLDWFTIILSVPET